MAGRYACPFAGRKYAKYEDRKKGEKELDIGHRVVVLAAEKVI